MHSENADKNWLKNARNHIQGRRNELNMLLLRSTNSMSAPNLVWRQAASYGSIFHLARSVGPSRSVVASLYACRKLEHLFCGLLHTKRLQKAQILYPNLTVIIRAGRKSQVRQCQGFCTAAADLWSLLAYESAELNPKYGLTGDFLSALVINVTYKIIIYCTLLQCTHPSLIEFVQGDSVGRVPWLG